MSSLLAGALDTWTSFLSAEEASARIIETAPSLSLTEVKAAVDDLIESGCLVSRSQLVTEDADINPQELQREIAWLAIPTADRAASVARAVHSYIDNIRHFERKCGILVSDDSRDAGHRVASLKMLAALRSDPAIPVWYIGPEEKGAFVKELTEKGDIPPEVIRFGLFGSESSVRTAGANRNAILLQTLGSMILSVDDDTVCSATVAPGAGDGFAIAGHFDPAEVWCFPERLAALSFGHPALLDVLGEHAQYLGKPVRGLLSRANGGSESTNLDRMCVHMLSSVSNGSTQIRVTYNGARGDSGFHSDIWQVASRSPATRKRVQGLGDGYRNSLNSRQLARQVIRPTISHIETIALGGFMGLDNTLPLPAFMPDCRNQDGVFANVLARTSDHYYAAHLPFTLAHDPPGGCRYAPGRDVEIRISNLLIYCVSTWQPEPGDNDPLRRMSAIGRHLRRLGALPAGDFDELAHVLMCSLVCATIESLESLLIEDGYAPRHWAEDLMGRIETLSQLTDRPDFFVPVDLPQDSDDPPQRRAQRIVARYGRLLEWWPAIAERTTELGKRGTTIARCLSGSGPQIGN
jgi:hypothetical protein